MHWNHGGWNFNKFIVYSKPWEIKHSVSYCKACAVHAGSKHAYYGSLCAAWTKREVESRWEPPHPLFCGEISAKCFLRSGRFTVKGSKLCKLLCQSLVCKWCWGHRRSGWVACQSAGFAFSGFMYRKLLIHRDHHHHCRNEDTPPVSLLCFHFHLFLSHSTSRTGILLHHRVITHSEPEFQIQIFRCLMTTFVSHLLFHQRWLSLNSAG